MKAELLEAIIKFTDQAHGEQKRKYTDERYIVHPIRVMQTCQQYTHNPVVLAAALMHDILEDTPVTQEQIRLFLSDLFSSQDVERTLALIVELTDIYTRQNFPKLNRRVRREKEFKRLSQTSNDAQTIKYADIMDNCVDILKHDPDFGNVFLREAKSLLQKIPNGNPILYKRAQHTVEECLNDLPSMARKKPVMHDTTGS